jgi:2,5-diamino-6-(ribosylamino)-4(3H)-pyrimidinone 5'-phosphate reductase
VYVHVNAAVSADGKLSTRRREQVRISGDEDFARVDRCRAEADAVLVGVGTVLADDPSLVRHDEEHRRAERGPDAPPPARVVVDSRGRTPTDAAVLAGGPETYVLASGVLDTERAAALRDAGATVLRAGDSTAERVPLPAAFAELEREGVERLFVEGGGEVIFSLFAAGLVDRLTLYVGSLILGGRDAPTLADGEGFIEREAFPSLSLEAVERLDDGVLLSYAVD